MAESYGCSTTYDAIDELAYGIEKGDTYGIYDLPYNANSGL